MYFIKHNTRKIAFNQYAKGNSKLKTFISDSLVRILDVNMTSAILLLTTPEINLIKTTL